MRTLTPRADIPGLRASLDAIGPLRSKKNVHVGINFVVPTICTETELWKAPPVSSDPILLLSVLKDDRDRGPL